MNIKYILITLFILTGCGKSTAIEYMEGPNLNEGSINGIKIESLRQGVKSAVIKDKDSIKTVGKLFSKYRWQKNIKRNFIPSYKIIIFTKSNARVNYWVGTFSDLNEPPCYKLCSGWWILSSDSKNKMNKNIYKSLSSSVGMFELSGLLDNAGNKPDK